MSSKFFPHYALSIIWITMNVCQLNTVFNFICLLVNPVFYMLDTHTTHLSTYCHLFKISFNFRKALLYENCETLSTSQKYAVYFSLGWESPLYNLSLPRELKQFGIIFAIETLRCQAANSRNSWLIKQAEVQVPLCPIPVF